MCFSVQVDRDLKKLAKMFHIENTQNTQHEFEQLKEISQNLGPEHLKVQLGLKRKPQKDFIKGPDKDNRIFPGYFAPVILQENNQATLKYMRYRIRPNNSKEEIPTKFNVFNARLDSLQTRKTWSPLFGKQHGLLPFKAFYEWVERDGKKKLIQFYPEKRDLMWAPCLWDKWESPDKSFSFYSFAIITDDPPNEIVVEGHDRCPIFLQEDQIKNWLNPVKYSTSKLFEILKSKEDVLYGHQL